MKTILYVTITSLLIILGCNRNPGMVNHFSSSGDTIILKAEKVKGLGFLPGSAGPITFKDTSEYYLFPVKIPGDISNIKLAWCYIDFKPLFFEDYKKGEFDTVRLITYITEKKIDTLIIPSKKDNFLSILSGQKGNNKLYIVDENNNKDLRDDSIRLYQSMDWRSSNKLICCKYRIFNGEEMVEDSSWVNIGTIGDNELWFFVSHHLESTFSIDNHSFQIEVGDEQSNFCFDDPVMALRSQNGLIKDTLLTDELIKKGEYIKIKNKYYCFYDISNNGRFITLIKENNFKSKIGTQVGMIAPDFNCHSMDDEIISLSDYKGKYLLLINVSSCWSPVSSYECYKDLTETYKGKIEFLGIDNSPSILLNNIENLNLTGKFVISDLNKMIQKYYRPVFCSRTCFLINPKGRLINKFEIFDWGKSLSESFD
jgi:peroxiredoxin